MAVPKPGDRISNYVLAEPVGAGSFGQVWLATHHVFGEQVAIKIPTDAQYVQNLRREGVTIHGLRHPNIVRAIDLDPYADPPYFVMEYVPGDSLRQVLDRRPRGLPIDAATRIMQGVLAALAVAHDAGVIHRDIKPANILLTIKADDIERVTPQSVKVTDFGLGRVRGATLDSVMQSADVQGRENGGLAGTLAYMSPEQMEGRELDGRSDLYSCGIVLFELLTGERPQGSELPSALHPELRGRLDDVFARCYTRLERRYGQATDMLADLSNVSRRRVAPLVNGQVVCPSCRAVVQPGDQYCIHCGTQLVKTVPRCQSCGAFVAATDRFCILCGEDLTRAKAG